MLESLVKSLNKLVLEKGISDNYDKIKKLSEKDIFIIPLPFSLQIQFTRIGNSVVLELNSEDDLINAPYTEYIQTICLDCEKQHVVQKILKSLRRIYYCSDCQSFKVARSHYLLSNKCYDCYEASLLVIPGDCVICMEPLSSGIPYVLQCSHAYHQQCILKVDEGLTMFKCPICRTHVEKYNWVERYSVVRRAILFNKSD